MESTRSSSCFCGIVRFILDLPELVGQQCPIFCKAAQQLPDIVGNVPPGSLVEQTPSLVGHLGVRRSLALVAGADATVLAQLLRDLPASKRGNLANVAENVNLEALLSVVHGEIDPALLVHFIEHVPPASMIQLLEEIPGESLIPLMTRVNAATVIELLNNVDASIICRLLLDLQPELIVGTLDRVADGFIDIRKIVKLLRGIDTASVIELMKSVPESTILAMLHQIDAKQILFLCAIIDSAVLAKVMLHIEASKVIDLIEKVDICRITGILHSQIDPMIIVDLINDAPMESIIDVMQKIELCRLIDLVEGSDVNVLRYVLRELPACKRANLIAVVTNVNMDALLCVVHGEIDPSVLVHYIANMRPSSLIQILEGIPESTLIPLMTRLDPTGVIDLVNRIDACIMIEVVCNVPHERIVTMLDNIAEGHVDSDRICKFVRGVETESVIELMKQIPISKIIPFLREVDAPSIVFICDSIDINVLISLILNVDTASVIEFVNRVDIGRIRGLLSSEADPMRIAELVNNAPLDSIIDLVQRVDVDKMAFLLQQIPVEQITKLVQKVPSKELASVLSRVDAQVVADIGGSTSATLLKNVIKVCHGTVGTKMLKLAPKTISSMLPVMRPVSPRKVPKRKAGSWAAPEGFENLAQDDFCLDGNISPRSLEDVLPEITLEDFLSDADFTVPRLVLPTPSEVPLLPL